jgi:hypothetical protein
MRSFVRRLLRYYEAIEDIALLHAIKEGEESQLVDKETVFDILEGQA